MSEQEQVGTDTLALEEEDRLPWLEAVDASEDEAAVSPGRLIGLVLGGLAAQAAELLPTPAPMTAPRTPPSTLPSVRRPRAAS